MDLAGAREPWARFAILCVLIIASSLGLPLHANKGEGQARGQSVEQEEDMHGNIYKLELHEAHVPRAMTILLNAHVAE